MFFISKTVTAPFEITLQLQDYHLLIRMSLISWLQDPDSPELELLLYLRVVRILHYLPASDCVHGFDQSFKSASSIDLLGRRIWVPCWELSVLSLIPESKNRL